MGQEYRIKFHEPAWYANNRWRVVERARSLEYAISPQPTPRELWLKDPDTDGWQFDVRLFFEETVVLVEVSAFSRAFSRGIADLLHWLQSQTPTQLVDDDGIPLTM